MTETINIRHRFSSLVEHMDRDGDKLTIQRVNYTPISFSTPSQECADALMMLNGEGATREELIAQAEKGDNSSMPDAIDYYLGRFCFGRLLAWDILHNGEKIAHLISQDRSFGPNETETAPQNLTLSRFAWLRRDGSDTVLESSETRGRVVLSSHAMTLLGRLPEHPEDEAVRLFCIALWRFGFMEDTSAAESPARRTWQFHDKLMHEMSRFHRDEEMPGATYRFKDVIPSPPALKPVMTGHSIALPEVEVSHIAQNSAPLHDIMERRTSGRDYGPEVLSLADLSGFLYRVARTKEVIDDTVSDVLSRPYPSGGSIHELEFYIAVRQCGNLSPGLYHYQGHDHRLVQIPDSEATSQQIHAVSASCMGQSESQTDVVIVTTSRVPRIAWKYETIAYRTSLLNAGVAMQTMYLVATDMGLQGCANGLGNSRLFEAVTGIDPFEEASIAEFALSAPAASV